MWPAQRLETKQHARLQCKNVPISLQSFGFLSNLKNIKWYLRVVFFFFSFYLFLRAVPSAYGSSQARGQIRAPAASLHHSRGNTRSKLSSTYAAPRGNTRSLTHWVRPRIKPSFSWTLCWVPDLLCHNGNSAYSFLLLSFPLAQGLKLGEPTQQG